MSKRLLGKEELASFFKGSLLRGESVETYLTRIRDRQADHTEQRERRMLGAWGREFCENPEHDPEWSWGTVKECCRDCIREMFQSLHKGLAPTESGQWPESEVG